MRNRLRTFFVIGSLAAWPAAAQTLFVGTYTRGTGRPGIFAYRFDTTKATALLLDSARSTNPSFLAPGRDGKMLYSVSEQGGGKGTVQAWRFRGGKLSFLNEVSSEGDDPCYVTIDKAGRNVIVANYSGGSLALFPVAPDGGVGPAEKIIAHAGSGPHRQQQGPHVHSTVLSPDEDYVLAADLGIDAVISYKYNSRRSTLSDSKKVNAFAAGSGPRHLEFHPKKAWVYVLQELSGTVTACRFRAGVLDTFQTVRLLPEGASAPAHSADIHVSPDGRFLYASNRNPTNHIAIFGIDPQTGMLTLLGMQDTGGKVPRNFTIHPGGKWLLVGNQDSDRINIFSIDKNSGLLTDTGKTIEVPSPVCLKWGE
ncbi:MAG: lactonase family protein [Chitinophagaceae bacterium]|nr:MAG: lactonase family protein [Chitinophagaceae bacterium]